MKNYEVLKEELKAEIMDAVKDMHGLDNSVRCEVFVRNGKVYGTGALTQSTQGTQNSSGAVILVRGWNILDFENWEKNEDGTYTDVNADVTVSKKEALENWAEDIAEKIMEEYELKIYEDADKDRFFYLAKFDGDECPVCGNPEWHGKCADGHIAVTDVTEEAEEAFCEDEEK